MFLHNQIKPDLYVKANAAIMDGSLGPQAIAAVRARMPHVIVINRQTKGFLFACTDNVVGGEIMANHALSCGHRRLGVIHYGEIDTEEEFIDFEKIDKAREWFDL